MYRSHPFSTIFGPYRFRLALGVVLAGSACLLNLPIPLIVQSLVSQLTGENDSAIARLLAALAAVFVVQGVVHWSTQRVLGGVGLDLVRDLRQCLYERLQKARRGYFDATSPGAIMSRVVDDVAAVQALASGPTASLLVDLGTSVLVIVLLGFRSVWILATVATIMPLSLYVFCRIGRNIRVGTEDVRRELDRVFGHLKTKFDGIAVVKAHAREDAEIVRFAEQMNAAHEPRLRVERWNAALSSLANTAVALGGAAVFAVAGLEALAGRMTAADVAAAGALAAILFAPLPRVADAISLVQQSTASLNRLREILDLETPRSTATAVAPPRPQGRVEFDEVSFSYVAGRPVLRGVTARIEPGTKVALVGPTGCGKTTLLNLLMRLYDPTAGEIRLDGVPLGDLDAARLRRWIGVVSQDAVLFRQSLADNIRYGVPGASRETVEAAARAAHIHDLAMSLPQEYDTIVGEGTFKLSQGERQRVAIARALCKNPSIVILDEATSSLDSESETLIQKALAELLRGRTTFVIAHRLSTVADADVIFVMNRGQLVQVGAHDQLIAQPGEIYHDLWVRQTTPRRETIAA